eukprot:TRINITY_DN10816_c0_g1_i1.p2 TRINITY_DN10816_c0_g1~~TRINITY_DN10816_c0_g1_i1.p2  ORF type:complete len:304 (+),score=120.19 TRINITY_DN10816_c0_g1_i1:101-1012(+)
MPRGLEPQRSGSRGRRLPESDDDDASSAAGVNRRRAEKRDGEKEGRSRRSAQEGENHGKRQSRACRSPAAGRRDDSADLVRLAQEVEEQSLESEVQRLQQRVDELHALRDRVRKVTEAPDVLRVPKRDPVLLLEHIQGGAAGYSPPDSSREKQSKKRLLLWDRENNCTQFMDGVVKIPSWLQVYCVWNPKSKNTLSFPPDVAKRVATIEAEYSVLRAMNALAGMLARENIEHASSTYIYLVFNAGNAPKRYLEIATVLKELHFKVEMLNGTRANFANFLNHLKKDADDYTRTPATRDNILMVG